MKHIKYVYALIVAFVVAMIGSVVGVYYVITQNVVEDTTLDNINEIVAHDKNSITMFVEFNWQNLKRIGERLKRRVRDDGLNNVAQINEYLGFEAYESNFDKVFLLMEDGSYYTDISYRTETTYDYYPFKDLFEGDRENVIGFGNIPVMNSETAIIYGYKLSEKHILSGIKIGEQGKEVAGIIGVCKRSTIEAGLVIESFVDDNGRVRGYSSLINYDGNYIVDRNNTASAKVENIFRHIEESESSDLTRAQVEEKMKNRETFWFYKVTGGARQLNYCSPLGYDLNWYFVMSVDDEALSEQTMSLVLMISIALAVVVVVSLAAMVVILIMQKKTSKAYAQEKAQSEFLSNMSHEIRTPLNGIIGLNCLMINAVNDPSKHEQFKEWLVKSNRTAKYLLSLISDILDISKLRAGKVDIVHEPILIDSIMDSIYSMQCDNVSKRGIEYITESKITVPCILGDDVRIKQILTNIVGNAAKFTPAGGTIKFSVSQSLIDEQHVNTVFVCEDTGCGMSKEFVAHIFDKFTQERNNNALSTKGTGLGMAISKLLVDAMGGDIKVESELGKGSKFTVSIPAEISDVPDYMKRNMDFDSNNMVAKKSESDRHTKVLVAEDNELNAEILIEILQDADFTCVHAANGQEAVDIFKASKENEFDIILMDMRMPVLDGCEATVQIRKLDRPDAKTIPIVACTANTFQEDKIKVLDSGMNDILTKPIDVKVLLQKIESFRTGKNPEDGEQEEQ